jgi:hypothetical protein
VLYKDSKHLEDLKKLAVVQRRANAFAGVTGQVPSFPSTDERLKELFGSGIQYITTTGRDTASGRISADNMAVALLVRLGGTLEKNIFKSMFAKAIEDKKFADQITSISSVDDAEKFMASMSKIGVPKSFFKSIFDPLYGSVSATGREITDAALKDQKEDTGLNRDLPVMGAARQMLRNLPPAPQSRGMPSKDEAIGGFRFKTYTPPPAQPAPSPQYSAQSMYQALFPNDPLGAMLQQRQQGGQQ